jgi:ribosomal protein S18 acetylase RimI-like enzyme
MTKSMTLRPLTTKDVFNGIGLLRQSHENEARHHRDFPTFDEYEETLNDQLNALIQHHQGWAAFQNEAMIGYMIGIAIGPLFGKDPGLVIPAHGWSVGGNRRSDTLRALLEQVLGDAIGQGHTSMAWTIMAHDRVAVKVARDWGMGNRCADALVSVMNVSPEPSSWRIEQLSSLNLECIASLHQAHNRYYRQAPLWMPNPDEDPLQDLQDWMTGDDRTLYAAFDATTAIGYLRTQPHAESYVSHHPLLRNITAAYVDPAYRQKGVAGALLNHALVDLRTRGIRWCGVDYETINPAGARFWERHLDPYTVSLTRRIDERITHFLNSKNTAQ